MDEIVRTAATAATGIALAVIAVGAARAVLAPRRAAAVFAGALALGLEFLLAGGLLRLATEQSLRALQVTAVIVVVRQVIARGIRFGRRAATAPG